MASHRKEPVEIWEDTWVSTMCGGCYSHCTVRVRRVNGVPIAVEGDPSSDWGAKGGVCGKAIGILQVLEDPYRVNYPLRRTNPKKGIGVDPKWKRISWEEALSEITERMASILKDNPNKALFGSSPPPMGYQHWINVGFFRLAFGSINTWNSPGISMCGAASHLLSGTNHCSWSTAPDFPYCNYAVYMGSGKGVGTGHSMAMVGRQRADALDRGLKTVAFDPICHQGGGRASEWIPILPGGDLSVCLAMANVIVNELGTYDAQFLKKKTNAPYLISSDGRYVRDEKNEPLLWDLREGRARPWLEPIEDEALEGDYEVAGVSCRPVFVSLKEHLRQYTPEWASKVASVPAGTLRRVAKEMVENARIGSTIDVEGVKLPYRPVAIAQFRGAQAHTTGYHTYQAGDLLVMLLGASEVPGGQIGWVSKCLGYPGTGLPRFGPVPSVDGFAHGSNWPPGFHGTWPHGEPTKPKGVTFMGLFPSSGIGLRCLPDHNERLKDAGIDHTAEFMFATGGNWIQSGFQSKDLQDFLEKPFIVMFDIYNTENTEGFADIVLPDASWLESYDITSGLFGWIFSHPVGMLRHEYAIRQPVVAPLYERRHFPDVILELCDRLGIRDKFNAQVNRILKNEGVEPHKLLPSEKKYSYEELIDFILNAYFGPEHDLDYFKEHGHIAWPKKPEEVYWRQFTDARAMIYSEYLIDQAEKSKALAGPAGIDVEWEQYTPLPTYFPNAIEKAMQADPSFDLAAFSFKDILHSSSWTHGIPWLAEMSEKNPYHYFALMNTKTAKEKGIRDGDKVIIESFYGTKTRGRVHTIEGIHPRAIGFVVGGGGWVKDRPQEKRLGVHYNNLLKYDWKHVCPITMNGEGGAAVKVYREDAS